MLLLYFAHKDFYKHFIQIISMILKVIGLILAFVGILMLKYFPGISEHQVEGFTLSGILIGVVLILVGAILVIFG